MLKIGVLVSGGGTNLQAILDAIDAGGITNAKVDIVISNNASAYALERARKHDIEAVCIAPKDYPDREAFHKALLAKLQEKEVDLIVLAGYLVAIPPMMVEAYPNKIINIHPSLIPSFCGKGFYGLKVHDAVLGKRRESNRRYGSFRRCRNGYRSDHPSEGSKGKRRRYIQGASETCNGKSRVEDPSGSNHLTPMTKSQWTDGIVSLK